MKNEIITKAGTSNENKGEVSSLSRKNAFTFSFSCMTSWSHPDIHLQEKVDIQKADQDLNAWSTLTIVSHIPSSGLEHSTVANLVNSTKQFVYEFTYNILIVNSTKAYS